MADSKTLLNGEEVLLVVRKSLFGLWKQGVKAAIVLLLASVALFFGANEYLFLLSILAYISLVIYLFVVFFVWFYDVYIVTNRRILVTAQKGIFHKENSEIDAHDIADVKSIKKGLFATVFGYGTVLVTTTLNKQVELHFVPDPDYISQSIHTVASTINRL